MPENDQKQNNAIVNEAGSTEIFSIPEPSREYRLDNRTITGIQKLADIFERMNLNNYLVMMQNPRRIIWYNLIAGLARGFGFMVGMTFLVGLLLFILGRMVDLPLIGKYIAKIVDIVQQEMKMRKY